MTFLHISFNVRFFPTSLIFLTPRAILTTYILQQQIIRGIRNFIHPLVNIHVSLTVYVGQDFKGMLDRVIHHLPRERQILLFSATFPLTVESFMRKHLTDP